MVRNWKRSSSIRSRREIRLTIIAAMAITALIAVIVMTMMAATLP